MGVDYYLSELDFKDQNSPGLSLLDIGLVKKI